MGAELLGKFGIRGGDNLYRLNRGVVWPALTGHFTKEGNDGRG